MNEPHISLGLNDGAWSAIEDSNAAGMSDVFKWNLIHQLKAYRDAININTISSITDRRGIIVYANDNFCKVSQYTVEELLGKNHRIVCSGFHSSSFFKEMWSTISAGKPWKGEILNKAKDGSLYWVDTVIIPVLDSGGHIVNYLSLRQLITERKEAELQKDRYVDMLEEIADIVAHKMRGPLCSIIGLVDIISRSEKSPEALHQAIVYLRKACADLDSLTHQLSEKIYADEIELRTKIFEGRIHESGRKKLY